MVCTWGCGWAWLGRRGPTQFCCSPPSRVVVSPGPFSGLSEGGDCLVRGGFWLEGLTEVGGVWEWGAWLPEWGLAWDND